MQGTSKEKAEILLQVIGVGEQLYEIENREKQLYNERTAIGRIADQKKKFAEEIVDYPEAPKELISISELILKQQEILAKTAKTNVNVKSTITFKAFRRFKSTNYKSSITT